MRNIHILETDRPTRLHWYTYGEFGLSKKHLPWKEGRNIYITNDHKPRQGDWYLTSDHKILKCKKVLMGIIYAEGDYGRNNNGCQKIILTTDKELDGVQVIDDIFLEWFVKNPSCESVEVKKEYITPLGDIVETCYDNERLNYKIIIPKEETLEEAANNYINSDNTPNDYESFIDGAEWQAERMYTEEHMKHAYTQGARLALISQTPLALHRGKFPTPDEWFNEFKKL